MAFKLAKDILLGNDFLQARSKAQKYVKHEFQDYAYRLANDLNDLEHKQIYMRLAKAYPRTMLEQAAAFALGYFNEPRKGKIFMWKLKQLSEYMQLKSKKTNFEPDFVFTQMAKLHQTLAPSLLKRWRSENDATSQVLNPILKTLNPAKSKVLMFTTRAGEDYKLMNGLVSSIEAVESVDFFKQQVLKINTKAKIVKKINPLTYKPKSKDYNLIWIPKLISFVPIDVQVEWLTGLVELLSNEGTLVIGSTIDPAVIMEWKELKLNETLSEWYLECPTSIVALQKLENIKLQVQEKFLIVSKQQLAVSN